jgi:ribose 5-phosphate isomerase B
MNVIIGCDHGGFALKNEIISHLKAEGYGIEDVGTYSEESCDYPDIAHVVAKAISEGKYERGILVCGTGIGMSLAANKHPGVRAAAVSDHFSCKYTRMHNDANILCLGGRVVGPGTALELCDLFLTTDFEGGRHARRVAKIEQID